MRLVEGVGGKLLPVAPDFLQHGGVIAVFHAAFDELRLHGVDNLFLLLTHCLAQRITLATGEVSQLTAQQHHLLLIDCDAVSVLQVFLHDGNIVGNGLVAMLTTDERRNVLHRTRTIERVHSDEILENGRLEVAQVFLHSGRLKLERADGAALLVERVGLRVVDGNVVEVDVDAQRLLHVGAGFLQLRQSFQAKEVHLDEACRLDDVAVILCAVGLRVLEVGVIGRRDGHPVADRVAADDEATGMDAGAAHRSLQHLRNFNGVGLRGVGRCLGLAQLRRAFDGVGQVHLHVIARQRILQAVGNGLAPCIAQRQRHLLHTRHVPDRVLRGHRGIGDDVRTILMSVLVLHPLQHTAAAVVVEIGINIRQGDTVGIEETLEQQVVLQRVNLRDAQAVGHHAAGSRATSGTYHDAQLLAC